MNKNTSLLAFLIVLCLLQSCASSSNEETIATQQGGSARALHDRGNAKSVQKDFRGAAVDFTAALALSPDRHEFYISRGHARSHFDPDGAIQDYSSAIRLQPRSAHAFRGMAFVKHKNGDARGALADCNQSIGIDPTIGHTYYVRYCCRRDLGDLVGAQADLEKYEELKARR